MKAVDITDDSFREIYQNNDIVVLDFWAPWCGPCHQFAPTFEKVAESYEGIFFGKVNTEMEQKLSGYFAIRSIPTLLIVREQLEVFRHSGVIGEPDLLKIIEEIRSTDMSLIKEKLGVTEEV